jgi:hypothetical protein
VLAEFHFTELSLSDRAIDCVEFVNVGLPRGLNQPLKPAVSLCLRLEVQDTGLRWLEDNL